MKQDNDSYNRIIKSTTIFGGSQFLVIVLGIVRAKIVAVLLGTVGVGLIGIYQSVIEMLRTSCSLGMDTAGVKDIAGVRENDDAKLYKTIARLNKWFFFSALIALFICILFCYPISVWAFETDEYAVYIAFLSVAAFFLILSTGRTVVLQGMRQIPQMAKASVLGSFIGLIITVPLYYFFRLNAILPSLIISALIMALCAEYYYRKLHFPKTDISFKEALTSGLDSFRLGIYIVISGFVATFSMFLVRAYISRTIDLDAAGLFQSSWVIANVYLGLILKSMGSDFFPRLSGISEQADKVKKLVNEQTYIILVIASPIIVGMLLFSDFALSVLYSSEFTEAGGILRWQVLGTFLKVLGWPVSFILLVKNKGFLFFLTELLFYSVYLLSGWLLYPQYGLDAAGICYLIAYAVYLPVIYYAGKSVSGFGWDKSIVGMTFINAVFIAIAFYIAFSQKEYFAVWATLILIVTISYAYFKLKKVFSLDDLRRWFTKK